MVAFLRFGGGSGLKSLMDIESKAFERAFSLVDVSQASIGNFLDGMLIYIKASAT